MDYISVELLTLLIAALTGAFAAEVFRYFTSRKDRDLHTLAKVYPILTNEIDRLIRSNNRLATLVEALENEIIFLGGDPIRIRKIQDDGLAELRNKSPYS
jgi:hypothetical protein